MRIQRLHIKGFRSLHDVEWKPGNLNVLIGANGSGKSNLLRAMEMLRESARGHLHDEIMRSGGIRSIAWDGITEELAWSVTADPQGDFQNETFDSLNYRLSLRSVGPLDTFLVRNENLFSENSRAGATVPTGGDTVYLKREFGKAALYDNTLKKLEINLDKEPLLETVLSTVSPFSNSYIVSNFKTWMGDWDIFHDIDVT